MKYLKLFESFDDKLYIVDSFIDSLFNHNDKFYDLGRGKYSYDESTGEIRIDLVPYEKEGEKYGVDFKSQFINEVKSFINSQYKSIWEDFGNVIYVGEKNNILILSVNTNINEKKTNTDKALKNKSKDSGIPVSILRKVYSKGMQAWNAGHRPGVTQHQWGMGRVNSFITGIGGARKSDADLWNKAKAAKERKKKKK
jgi:hypothetical protein